MKQVDHGGRISEAALLRLWRRYHDTADISARDRLVFSLSPIVKGIVYRKVREIPAYREVDDLISCGLEALIRTLDRYDPEKGATLEQFAWMRIHGAVLDELRRYDWAPRSLRRRERECNRARERFTVRHGRAPRRDELAELLTISEHELRTLTDEIARCDIGSLSTLVLSDDDRPRERMDTLAATDRSYDPEHAAMRAGAIARFRVAFDELPPRERRVAVLLHVSNLTLRETGEILGVSESRVCQIHGKLKRRLRERLREDQTLFLDVA